MDICPLINKEMLSQNIPQPKCVSVCVCVWGGGEEYWYGCGMIPLEFCFFRVASFQLYLLNQCVDFDQTCIYSLLGGEKD